MVSFFIQNNDQVSYRIRNSKTCKLPKLKHKKKKNKCMRKKKPQTFPQIVHSIECSVFVLHFHVPPLSPAVAEAPSVGVGPTWEALHVLFVFFQVPSDAEASPPGPEPWVGGTLPVQGPLWRGCVWGRPCEPGHISALLGFYWGWERSREGRGDTGRPQFTFYP